MPFENSATVSQRIKTFNAHLIKDKVQLKYKLLAADAFRFFRGTNHLFYEDLSKCTLPDSPLVWLCGDLHLENFGSYKGDNRLVYFDINDFDEAVLGPANWDLVRMITSIFTGFEVLGIGKEKSIECVKRFLKTYASILQKGKPRYIEAYTAKGIVRSFLEKVSRRTQKELIKERVKVEKRKIVFRTDNKKYLSIDQHVKEDLTDHMAEWAQKHEKKMHDARLIDACFRIAGTGSLGVKRYMLLLASAKSKKKYFLLDMKQVMPSSLQPYVNAKQPVWNTEAERSISVKFISQNVSPALLDTIVFREDAFSLQELQPSEDKIDFTLIKNSDDDLEFAINNMALLVASAQLRGTGRQGSAIADALIEFGKSDHWQKQMIDYGQEYAQQVKKDHESFVSDFEKGFFND